MGPGVIGFVEIYAWACLTDTRIAPHEVKAIIALDFETRNPSKKDSDDG